LANIARKFFSVVRACAGASRRNWTSADGALKANIYPGAPLMKVNPQFSSLRKGALDMTLIPLSYAISP
jgi:TRAP-type C4-dicarboxylate transport system substrate-binding protein